MMRMRAPEPIALAISTSCCSGMERPAHFRSRVHRRTDALQQCPGPLRALTPFHEPERPRRIERQRDILRDRKIGEESRLLINAGDAELMRGTRSEMLDDFTGDFDGSRIGPMRPRDDFDQRRFARAIFPEKGVHFAGLQRKRDASQRADGEKGFCDVRESEERGSDGSLGLKLCISRRGAKSRAIHPNQPPKHAGATHAKRGCPNMEKSDLQFITPIMKNTYKPPILCGSLPRLGIPHLARRNRRRDARDHRRWSRTLPRTARSRRRCASRPA